MSKEIKPASKLHRIVWDTVWFTGFAAFGTSVGLFFQTPRNYLAFGIACTVSMFCFVGLGVWVGIDMWLKGELRPYGKPRTGGNDDTESQD